jgi:hypothetical protein
MDLMASSALSALSASSASSLALLSLLALLASTVSAALSASLVSMASSALSSVLRFVSFVGLCYHWLCNGFVAAIIVAATAISWLLKHSVTCGVATLFAAVLCNHDRLAGAAAKSTWWLNYTASHGVTVLRISTSKIVNTATAFHVASSLHVRLFMREKMMCRWLALARKNM